MDATEFNAHPVWDSSRQVTDLLTECEPGVVGDGNVAAIERVRFIVSILESYKAVESQLFVTNQLDTANSQWQAVVSSLNTAKSMPNQGYETQAGNQAETWLREAGAWHKPQARSNSVAMQAKAEYQSLVDSYRSANESLREAVVDLTSAQAAREAEHATEINSIKTALAGAEASLAALESSISNDKSLMQSALSDQSEKFIDAQASRSDKFTEHQSSRAEKFTKWLDEQTSEFSEIAEPYVEGIKESDSEAVKTLERIKSLGSQTEIAAGLTNGDILSTKFADYADQERTTSFWGFGAGIVATCLGIAWLTYVAIASFHVQGELSWPWLALKIGLTLALGGLATVLFRYGQQSLQTSRAYKRIELELRAIGPFLSDITDVTAADTAKIAFLKRTFGKAWEGDKRKSTPSQPDAESSGPSALESLTAAIAAMAERLPK